MTTCAPDMSKETLAQKATRLEALATAALASHNRTMHLAEAGNPQAQRNLRASRRAYRKANRKARRARAKAVKASRKAK